MRNTKFTRFVVGALIGLSAVVSLSGSASALSGSDFQPGRIIDDQVFYNPNDMNVSQIQAFLNYLVPTCDVNGDQPYYGTYGGVTYNGNILRKNLDPRYPPPYTCMKDYYENTTTHANNIGTSIPPGAISAAQIIYNEAQNYGINPKDLITLIEKESLGPLPIDDWPWPTEYKTVTGYGCPDSSVCDSQYYGFYNQVHNAARQFRLYTNNPNNYNYTIGANNIKYHPDPSSCGTELVNIVNQSTANLYNYTPYVPNQAALNNLYGLGDSCSAYGNRNFWRIFNDWFGSTFGGDPVSITLKLTGPITISPSSPIPGQPVTATYTVQNISAASVTTQAEVTQCRYFKTGNCDPAWDAPITLAAGATHTFTTPVTTVRAGSYSFTPYFELGGVWYRYSSDIGGGNSLSFQVPAYVASMWLLSMSASPAAPLPGQTVTVSYTVLNYGDKPAIFQNSVLQCRFNTYANCDPPWNAPVTIDPGAQQTFTNTFVVRAGTYVFFPYYQQNDTWYHYGSNSSNYLTVGVPAYVASMWLLSMSASPAAPIPGQTVTVTYTVLNYGEKPAIFQNSVLQCRLNTYTNCDPPWNAPVTISPGAQQTFTNTFVARAGTYTLMPYYQQNDAWYHYGSNSANYLTLNVPAYVASMWLLSMSASPAAPVPGQNVTVTYTVLNYGDKPAIFQNSVLQCRFSTNTNCDPPWNAPVTIDPGQQQTFTNTFTSVRAGTYVFFPYYQQNDTWYHYGSNSSNYLTVSVPAI